MVLVVNRSILSNLGREQLPPMPIQFIQILARLAPAKITIFQNTCGTGVNTALALVLRGQRSICFILVAASAAAVELNISARILKDI